LMIDSLITCIPNQIAGITIVIGNKFNNYLPTCSNTIADLNFAAAIAAACPTCIKGNILQPPAKKLKSLNLHNKNIRDLTGIDYFTALTTLICSNNQLKSLPTLPPSLTELDCSRNLMTDFPPLPLPASLTTLNISSNQFVTLNSRLTGQPPKLPASLTTFNCSYNFLVSVPPLPASLKVLDCSYNNRLTRLRWLPASLKELVLGNNTCIPNQVEGLKITDEKKTAITPTTCPVATPSNAYVKTLKGASDAFALDTSIATGLSGGSAVTIEYWFKGTNLQSAVRLQKDMNNYIVAGWGSTPLHIISTDGGINGVSIKTANSVNVYDNQWHHVAMTWEKNKPDGFKSYVDGVLVAKRKSENVNLPDLKGATPMVGAFVNKGAKSEFTNGEVARIIIWSVARTEAQINESIKCEYCFSSATDNGLLYQQGTPQ
jgi:Concanavalin A-like lectin/glucanases superfamily/Leucine Rich repeats (2 copies)